MATPLPGSPSFFSGCVCGFGSAPLNMTSEPKSAASWSRVVPCVSWIHSTSCCISCRYRMAASLYPPMLYVATVTVELVAIREVIAPDFLSILSVTSSWPFWNPRSLISCARASAAVGAGRLCTPCPPARLLRWSDAISRSCISLGWTHRPSLTWPRGLVLARCSGCSLSKAAAFSAR